MIKSDNKRKFWRRRAPFATLATAAIALGLLYSHAQAQQPAQPPYALFEHSTLTGSGDTITASWIPVVTASGSIIYKNMTLQFNVDSAGNLSLAGGFPKVVPAPIVEVSSFVSGTYVGPSGLGNGKALITVSGPGVTDGGATEWSLTQASGAYTYTYPESATWYVGPLANSPLAPRLQAAKISSTAWSYGIVGSQTWNVAGRWFTNSLIGLSQVGNTLTIVDFTDQNGADHNTPLDEITYLLQP